MVTVGFGRLGNTQHGVGIFGEHRSFGGVVKRISHSVLRRWVACPVIVSRGGDKRSERSRSTWSRAIGVAGRWDSGVERFGIAV